MKTDSDPTSLTVVQDLNKDIADCRSNEVKAVVIDHVKIRNVRLSKEQVLVLVDAVKNSIVKEVDPMQSTSPYYYGKITIESPNGVQRVLSIVSMPTTTPHVMVNGKLYKTNRSSKEIFEEIIKNSPEF